MKIKRFLKAEFLNGQTAADWIFMAVGILTQIAAIVYTCMNPGTMTGTQIFWTSVSGLTGVISVVLCAQGKISFYLFGFIQTFSYIFAVAIPDKLWGEVGENVFYVVTMIAGVVIWWKNYRAHMDGSVKVRSKAMDVWGWLITGVVLVGSTVSLALVLMMTDDPLPWFDSITTTAPFIAQIFLMLGFRDQWVLWAVEDVLSLAMFAILGNWIMVMQYIFWTVNCVYGFVLWTHESNKEVRTVRAKQKI